MRSNLSAFMFGALAAASASVHTAVARSVTVCDEVPEFAAAKLVGYSDEEVSSMGRSRIIGVPRFRSKDDDLPLDQAIQTYYLRNQTGAAVLVYAADSEHMCAFVFGADKSGAFYARRPYVAGRLTALMKELAGELKLYSLWAARSGKRVAEDERPDPPTRGRSEKEILREISLELFWPSLQEALKDRGITHLSIVPIKEISSVPIAALEPFGDGRKVVDLFSVNILAFLADVKKGSMPWPRSFERATIVGNPRPSLDSEYKWLPLAGAEKEAKRVNKMFGGELLLEEQATRSSVLQSIIGSDLVYFAAHGFSDEANALDRSFIVLADGRLTAREVQALTLRKQPIVVLSACQTGEGRVMEAGIVGIARAFQLGQAWNTVMSLWAVDDEATAILNVSLLGRAGLGHDLA